MVTVVKNVRIITGTEQVIENGCLQFEDGQITGVSHENLPGEQEIDGTGKTIIPGLIDCQVYLGQESAGQGYSEQPENETAMGARIMKQCLELPRYGVTCVCNGGTANEGDMIVRDALERNKMISVKILASGTPVTITGGYGNCLQGFDSGAEVLRETRRKIKQNADVLKFVIAGGRGTEYANPDAVDYRTEELEAAVDEAQRCGRITLAFCNTVAGARTAVEAGFRAISHAPLDADTTRLMKDREKEGKEIFFCPALSAEETKSVALEKKMKAVRFCHEAGIRICAASDTNASGVLSGGIWKEIERYTQCGLSSLEAIQTATWNAAQLCLLDKETGTLEIGKSADFVILSGNPLEDISCLELIEQTRRRGICLYEKKEAFKR